MKRTLCVVLAMLAAPAFAQSTSTTGVNGVGVSINGMAQQTLGGKTATINVGNTAAPKLTTVNGGAPAGTSIGTFSAGLSVGGLLGNGSGNTGGTAGSLAGFGF